MPSPIRNFAGLSFNDTCGGVQCGGGWPPDPNGDVGPSHYIEAVNTGVAIYDKTGTLLTSFEENQLWSGVGTTPCNGNSQGDPIIIYDWLSDRFVLTWFAFASGSGPFSYQWRRDGLDIAGAISSTYTLPAASAGDAGTYCVVVTGACNSVTNCATLTVTGCMPVTSSTPQLNVQTGLFDQNVQFTNLTDFTFPALRVSISGLREGKETIQVLPARKLAHVAVGRIAADAEALNAQRME